MNDIANLEAISTSKPDYFGFIFYDKSPRCLTLETLPELQNIKKVGVFVNAKIDTLLQNQNAFNLDVIQLHGDETIEYVLKLKSQLKRDTEIFKALSISDESDFNGIKSYETVVDMFILDTKTPLKGGSGLQFDWQLLENFNSEKSFLLSGGIGPKDPETVKNLYKKYPKMMGVDINSKFEISPGLKSVDKVAKFITQLKN